MLTSPSSSYASAMQSTLRSSSAHLHSPSSRCLANRRVDGDTQCASANMLRSASLSPGTSQARFSRLPKFQPSLKNSATLLESSFTPCQHFWVGREVGGFSKKPIGRRAPSGAQAAAAGATLRETDDKWALYEALGIARDVGLGEVKSAYRQLARRYHPDVCPAEEKTACVIKFIEIQSAYEVLSDPAQRAMYDYEQTHYTKARRNASGIGRPWEKKRRPWENFDVHDWQSGAEKEETLRDWRSGWNDQLSGLKQRAAAKAARAQYERQEQHASMSDHPRERSFHETEQPAYSEFAS